MMWRQTNGSASSLRQDSRELDALEAEPILKKALVDWSCNGTSLAKEWWRVGTHSKHKVKLKSAEHANCCNGNSWRCPFGPLKIIQNEGKKVKSYSDSEVRLWELIAPECMYGSARLWRKENRFLSPQGLSRSETDPLLKQINNTYNGSHHQMDLRL